MVRWAKYWLQVQDRAVGRDVDGAFAHGLDHLAVWLLGTYQRVDLFTGRRAYRDCVHIAGSDRTQRLFGLRQLSAQFGNLIARARVRRRRSRHLGSSSSGPWTKPDTTLASHKKSPVGRRNDSGGYMNRVRGTIMRAPVAGATCQPTSITSWAQRPAEHRTALAEPTLTASSSGRASAIDQQPVEPQLFNGVGKVAEIDGLADKAVSTD